MDALSRSRFDRMEAKKAALFERLVGVTDEVLNRFPAEGEWSVAQVLAHLCLVEELSVRHLRERMAAAAPPGGAGSRLRSAALSLALRSGLRFKAPAMTAELPDRSSLAAIRERWDGVRVELEAVLGEVPPELATRALFRHPRAGRLTLAQAVRFMEEHLDHHRPQVERVLARVGRRSER
jgi:uncharacterized damage-inducible protein DinB